MSEWCATGAHMTDEEPVVVGQVERPSGPPFVLYGCKRHAAVSPKAVMRKTLRDRVIESG
ncbi:hypothetical protein [Streptomyces sp. NBC_01361]|uniref:hypothetical protein n=1 Tax=Streptomyces sp. NBC_01361 TaxID=2903838 RepID=UPI002E31AAA5|nr:hypothetical protein [Streptomyces sp. NBC_01361]